jgi:hypothetical protein
MSKAAGWDVGGSSTYKGGEAGQWDSWESI